MPNKNMTKKEIHKASNEKLVIRMDALFTSTEDVESVSLADAKECVEIDRELKRRFGKMLAPGRK